MKFHIKYITIFIIKPNALVFGTLFAKHNGLSSVKIRWAWRLAELGKNKFVSYNFNAGVFESDHLENWGRRLESNIKVANKDINCEDGDISGSEFCPVAQFSIIVAETLRS